MKTLVVYFSRKGYVKKLALSRAETLGAELLELKTKERTEGFLGFWWCGRFGMHRWGMELLPHDTDVSEYDRVIICSPVWVFSVCAPVRQFLLESAGRIKNAEYILVHFSPFVRCGKIAADMDELLKTSASPYESVKCVWGHILKKSKKSGRAVQG